MPSDTSSRWKILTGHPAFLVGLVGFVWLCMGAVDWGLRFSWYQWQRNLLAGAALPYEGPNPPLVTNRIAATRGGDLSHLLGIPEAARRFEVPRPARVETTDEFGFRNPPPTRGVHYPVVVVGDSFMNAGGADTNLFSAQLSRATGLRVYNYAHPARGPFFALVEFYGAERFRASPPSVLVWGLLEREISGQALVGMLAQLYALDHPGAAASLSPTMGGVRWRALSPSALRVSLPNTSALAQAGRKLWNYVRYRVAGRMSPDVVVSVSPIAGRPILFYNESIKAMKWSPALRNTGQAVWAITYFREHYCLPRGMELVVVLIPDKGQVYREYLPPHLDSPEDPIPPSCLGPLEDGLCEHGVPVVNLLPPFRDRAARGELLYWPDDTHWSPEGIRLAAQLTAEVVKKLPKVSSE